MENSYEGKTVDYFSNEAEELSKNIRDRLTESKDRTFMAVAQETNEILNDLETHTTQDVLNNLETNSITILGDILESQGEIVKEFYLASSPRYFSRLVSPAKIATDLVRISARQLNQHTLSDFVGSKRMGKFFGKLRPLYLRPEDSASLHLPEIVSDYCERLEVHNNIETLATKLVSQTHLDISGRDPLNVARAAIYVAANNQGERLSLEKLSNETGNYGTNFSHKSIKSIINAFNFEESIKDPDL